MHSLCADKTFGIIYTRNSSFFLRSALTTSKKVKGCNATTVVWALTCIRIKRGRGGVIKRRIHKRFVFCLYVRRFVLWDDGATGKIHAEEIIKEVALLMNRCFWRRRHIGARIVCLL